MRESGDFSQCTRAGVVLDRALSVRPDDEAAVIGQATLALARTWLARSLARNPRFSALDAPRARHALNALR